MNVKRHQQHRKQCKQIAVDFGRKLLVLKVWFACYSYTAAKIYRCMACRSDRQVKFASKVFLKHIPFLRENRWS